MKKILLCLLGLSVYASLSASMKWNWDNSHEFYDFEYNGIYYGIISESRAEVHVMNPYTPIYYDPYPDCEPSGLEPEYRLKSFDWKGEEHYAWPGGYYKGDVEIPSTVVHDGKEYAVVRIAYGAFAWCDELTSIKLPSTLREIRYGAFSMCTSLKEIDIPAGTRVCGGAFAGCSSLTKLDFSECEFQYEEFEADVVVCLCESLEEVYLPQRWHKEPFHCYPGELPGENYKLHHYLGDYYLDYDDFPYTPCEEHTETGWSSMGGHGQVPNPYPDRSQGDEYGSRMRASRSDDFQESAFRQYFELLGNPNLKKIHATSDIPMTLYGEWNVIYRIIEDPWTALYDSCVLYVPEGSLEAYRSTFPWSNFKTIVEEARTTLLENISTQPGDTLPRYVYDLSGNLRATVSGGTEPQLAPGFYIERRGELCRKIIVK